MSKNKAKVGEHSAISYIYALSHPITNEVRYIGKANSLKERLKSHLRETRRESPIYSWIKKLKSQNLLPRMEVVKAVNRELWELYEIEFISIFREHYKLLNVSDGGNEPKPYGSQEIKEMKYIKAALTTAYRRGELKERTISKMRECALRKPHMFKSWIGI